MWLSKVQMDFKNMLINLRKKGYSALADPGGCCQCVPLNRIHFFCFCICLCQKVYASEVGAPPPMGQHPPNGKSWIHHCSGIIPFMYEGKEEIPKHMQYEVSMTVCMSRIANQRKVPKWLPFKNYMSESPIM